MGMDMTTGYYSLKDVLSNDWDSTYNIIFGKRSAGKTTAVQLYFFNEIYSKDNTAQLIIIRRWDINFTPKNTRNYFDLMVSLNKIEEITKGKWNEVSYRSGSWYFSKFDKKKNKRIMDSVPFATGIDLNRWEAKKGNVYDKVQMIVFEEFLSTNEIFGEWGFFINVISTVVRLSNRVKKIFLLGNTINFQSTYFKNFGMRHVSKMKPGDILRYQIKNTKISVEYTESTKDIIHYDSDIYFPFDDNETNMIMSGEWALPNFPQYQPYNKEDILFTYFIKYEEYLLHCDIVKTKFGIITNIHEKTTPILHPEKDIVFTDEYSEKTNYYRRITNPTTNLNKKILSFYAREKVFYRTNEIGQIVKNYLKWCKTGK